MPQLLVHGWWNIGGAKMSKSVGNIVDPFVLADKYSVEALRYYLMSDIATGYDSDFEADRLENLYNNDLANSLGNLLNRTLSMTSQYRQGRLDRSFEKQPGLLERDSLWSSVHLAVQMRTIPDLARIIHSGFSPTLDPSEIHYHIGRVNHLNKLCNELVEIAAPWKLAKDPTRGWELNAVLYYLAESLRVVAVFMSIVIPKASHGIFDQLNWKMELSGKEERFSLADAEWGKLPDGHVVGKPVPLFPRIER
jgi:methionyl-tRNA synthetase